MEPGHSGPGGEDCTTPNTESPCQAAMEPGHVGRVERRCRRHGPHGGRRRNGARPRGPGGARSVGGGCGDARPRRNGARPRGPGGGEGPVVAPGGRLSAAMEPGHVGRVETDDAEVTATTRRRPQWSPATWAGWRSSSGPATQRGTAGRNGARPRGPGGADPGGRHGRLCSGRNGARPRGPGGGVGLL